MESRDVCVKCGPSDLKFKWCSKCRGVKYCSPECQRKDWSRHKLECLPVGDDTVMKRNRVAKLIGANHDFIWFATAMAHYGAIIGGVVPVCKIKSAASGGEDHYMCSFELSTPSDPTKFKDPALTGKYSVLIEQEFEESTHCSGFLFAIEDCKTAYETLESGGIWLQAEFPIKAIIVGRDAFIIRHDNGTTITLSSGKLRKY